MAVMTQGPYEAGDLVTVATYSGSVLAPVDGWRNRAGVLTDPTTVILRYHRPDGTTVTATYPATPVVRDGIGLYHADLDTTALPGEWLYEWQAPAGDPVQAVETGSFVVSAPGF